MLVESSSQRNLDSLQILYSEDLRNAAGTPDYVFRKHLVTPHLTSNLILILSLQGPNVCLIQAESVLSYSGE